MKSAVRRDKPFERLWREVEDDLNISSDAAPWARYAFYWGLQSCLLCSHECKGKTDLEYQRKMSRQWEVLRDFLRLTPGDARFAHRLFVIATREFGALGERCMALPPKQRAKWIDSAMKELAAHLQEPLPQTEPIQ